MPAPSPVIADVFAPPRSALAALHAAAAPLLPLPALDGDGYAAGHAAFEARSTQRALLTGWLRDRLVTRTGDVAVLSVGCGDGTVDVQLARALAETPGRTVRYDGVDPHRPSVDRFLAAVGGVDDVQATGTVGRGEHCAGGATYDVVLCVHSLYYVHDLAATLRQLVSVLSPGGEVVVVLAPLGDLNRLTSALAPPLDGHAQWWSHDLADALVEEGLDAEHVALHGTLSLQDCLDPADGTGRQVLDFAVQAELPDALRGPVLDHLTSARLPAPGLAVDHPVDVWTVPAPDGGHGT